jgi:hypothetical protein
MATLAQEMFRHSCREVEVLPGGLGQDKDYVIKQLTRGSILLIPYPLNIEGIVEVLMCSEGVQ